MGLNSASFCFDRSKRGIYVAFAVRVLNIGSISGMLHGKPLKGRSQ
jgi:hypothetical protein